MEIPEGQEKNRRKTAGAWCMVVWLSIFQFYKSAKAIHMQYIPQLTMRLHLDKSIISWIYYKSKMHFWQRDFQFRMSLSGCNHIIKSRSIYIWNNNYWKFCWSNVRHQITDGGKSENTKKINAKIPACRHIIFKTQKIKDKPEGENTLPAKTTQARKWSEQLRCLEKKKKIHQNRILYLQNYPSKVKKDFLKN